MERDVIALTGGAQGIGKAITISFLNDDFAVSLIDNDREAIEELKNELNNENLLAFHGNVSDEKDIKDWVKLTIENFCTVNTLINNVAVSINKPITELSYEEWKYVINVNLSSIFLTVKYFSTHLAKSRGSIINVASTRAFQSEKNTEAYSASKGGVVSLTHALAISLGPDIRVNCISPGWIDTSNWKKKSLHQQLNLKQEDHLQHPCGRVGKPEDIVNMVKFLISKENDFITGANFIVDGGMTKKMIYIE